MAYLNDLPSSEQGGQSPADRLVAVSAVYAS